MTATTAVPAIPTVTAEEIAAAAALGACTPALHWLGETPRTWEEVAVEYGGWILEYAAHLLTPERLDACALKYPWAALEYAAHLLTPERLDACALKYPRAALKYAAHPRGSSASHVD
jgi:hypothetical protein